MNTPRLLSIDEAADLIGVPKASLRTAADEYGKTIRIGRAVRLHPNDLEELIELCRVDRKGHTSTGGSAKTAPAATKSETEAPALRPAQTAAKMLKTSSRPTSSGKTGQLVRLPRKN